MPTAAQYEEQIRRLRRPGLLALWRQIKAGTPPGWEHGKALEYLVVRAFELEGAAVVYPYEVRDGRLLIEQIDGVVYADQLTCLLESKDLGKPLDHDPLADLRDQLQRRPPSVIGCCASTSGFTLNARRRAVLTAPQRILLWEAPEIEYALSKGKMCRGLYAKYRHCVERAMPDFNIKAAKL
jgi:hypothetical protein